MVVPLKYFEHLCQNTICICLYFFNGRRQIIEPDDPGDTTNYFKNTLKSMEKADRDQYYHLHTS